jgi:hypothetical protein
MFVTPVIADPRVGPLDRNNLRTDSQLRDGHQRGLMRRLLGTVLAPSFRMARLWFWERLFVHVKPVVKRREGASGRRALRVAALAASLLSPWVSPGTAAAGTPALPTNLRVPADLRRQLEALLDASPTFRRQCDLIRRTPRVRITVGYDRRRSALIDAETVFERHEYGSVVVTTTIYLPGDIIELVAHELEHVCEQIEGVKLEELAQQNPDEVHQFGGRYETRRAMMAGRRAVQEFRARTMTPSLGLAGSQ